MVYIKCRHIHRYRLSPEVWAWPWISSAYSSILTGRNHTGSYDNVASIIDGPHMSSTYESVSKFALESGRQGQPAESSSTRRDTEDAWPGKSAWWYTVYHVERVESLNNWRDRAAYRTEEKLYSLHSSHSVWPENHSGDLYANWWRDIMHIDG